MKQNIKIYGDQGRMMGMDYFRVMPHCDLNLVGSFFFLDHFPEQTFAAVINPEAHNIGAHPHRGITTVTYVIAGENEHRDSLGHHAVVKSGGLQWMKAGSGIVHDEGPTVAFLRSGGKMHMMQFWLVLNGAEREDAPDYMPLLSKDIQTKVIDDKGSLLRVLIGGYCGLKSPIAYKKPQFLYHLSLEAYSEFFYTIPADTEMAIFVTKGSVQLDGVELRQSELAAYDQEGQTLELRNETGEVVDIMLFGGSPFGESIYSQGPFVMGDATGMRRANEDYFKGKYGEVKY